MKKTVGVLNCMPLWVWLSLVHKVHMATTIETSGEKHFVLVFPPNLSYSAWPTNLCIISLWNPTDKNQWKSGDLWACMISSTQLTGKADRNDAGLGDRIWVLEKVQPLTWKRFLKIWVHLCPTNGGKRSTCLNIPNICIYIHRPWTMKALQNRLSLCDGFTVRKKLPDAQQELIEVSWSNQGVLLSHLGRIL